MLHGTQTGRPGASRFNIRGTVVGQISRSEGWWIFKKTLKGIKIQLNAEELYRAEEKFGKVSYVQGGEGSIQKEIELFMEQETLERMNFFEGTKISVTFAKGGHLEQFYYATEPIMIVDVQNVESNSSSEKETLTA